MAFIRTSRPAILVIEDDTMMRLLYDAVLTRWGYAVRCVASTDDAVAALESGFIPDAIVSDYHLGRFDTGVAAIRAVYHWLGSTPPAIIITGEPEAVAAGEVPVLSKPIQHERLKQVVADILRLPAPLTSSAAGRASGARP